MKKLFLLLSSLLFTSGAFAQTMTLNEGNLTIGPGGEIEASQAEWYHCHHVYMNAISKGASGSTWTAPDANTTGGWQLDAANEYLYANLKV